MLNLFDAHSLAGGLQKIGYRGQNLMKNKGSLIRVVIMLLVLSISGASIAQNTQVPRIHAMYYPPVEYSKLLPITDENAHMLTELARFRLSVGDRFLDHLSFTFVPNKLEIIISGNGLTVLDLITAEAAAYIEGPRSGNRVIVSPDGRLVSTWHRGNSGSAEVWNLESGVPLNLPYPIAPTRYMENRSGANAVVYAEAFNMEGTTLTTFSSDGIVEVWSLSTGLAIDAWQTCGFSSTFLRPDFSPDGTLFACGNLTRIWNTSDRSITLELPTTRTGSIAFSPDGTYLATASNGGNMTSVWEVETGDKLGDISFSNTTLALGTQGSVVVMNTLDMSNSNLVVWSTQTGQELITIENDSRISWLEFNSDGTLLGFTNSEGWIRIFGVAPCMISADRDVNLRYGPGTGYSIGEILKPDGPSAAVNGKSQQGNYLWWRLTNGLWAREDITNSSGYMCDSIPSVDLP